MLTLPIIEHFNILKDILPGLITGGTVPMGHELTLARPEETFDAGVIPVVAFAAHAGDEAVRIEQALVACGGKLGGFKWSLQPNRC